jgi:hypothetical protein
MTLKEQSENMIWYWYKKPVKLGKLTNVQLSIIKNTLIKSKSKNWFGISKDSWLNAIKILEKHKANSETKEAVNLIINNRIKNAEKNAQIITNFITNSYVKYGDK